MTSPAAPTSLTATPASAAQINLSWTAPSGTVSGYNVYRGTTPGGESGTPLNGGTLVTTTTYSDTTANYTSAVLNDNPAGYCLLNETSGTTAVNIGSAGSAGNGVYSGVTLNQPGPSLAGMADASAFSAAPAPKQHDCRRIVAWQRLYGRDVDGRHGRLEQPRHGIPCWPGRPGRL